MEVTIRPTWGDRDSHSLRGQALFLGVLCALLIQREPGEAETSATLTVEQPFVDGCSESPMGVTSLLIEHVGTCPVTPVLAENGNIILSGAVPSEEMSVVFVDDSRQGDAPSGESDPGVRAPESMAASRAYFSALEEVRLFRTNQAALLNRMEELHRELDRVRQQKAEAIAANDAILANLKSKREALRAALDSDEAGDPT